MLKHGRSCTHRPTPVISILALRRPLSLPLTSGKGVLQNMKQHHKMPSSVALRACPLCGRILPHWRLHKHIPSEHWRMRNEIIAEIRQEHPGWVEQDGVCRRCWESYRGVARVVRFTNRFKFPKRWRWPRVSAHQGPCSAERNEGPKRTNARQPTIGIYDAGKN